MQPRFVLGTEFSPAVVLLRQYTGVHGTVPVHRNMLDPSEAFALFSWHPLYA